MSVDGPRTMRLAERQDLIDHVNRVMRQEVGSDPTYGEDWPHVHQPENVQNIQVIREDDQIVASTAIYPHDTRIGDVRLRIGGINGVSTDVAYRRRGYATRVLDACIERMAELGSPHQPAVDRRAELVPQAGVGVRRDGSGVQIRPGESVVSAVGAGA